jgi:hypothetical protein
MLRVAANHLAQATEKGNQTWWQILQRHCLTASLPQIVSCHDLDSARSTRRKSTPKQICKKMIEDEEDEQSYVG